jgi:hypothetical protein
MCLTILLIVLMQFLAEHSCSNLKDQTCSDKIGQKYLPSALVIGVKKSGTYALMRYLNLNPWVRTALRLNGCNNNEIHFFDKYYDRGLDWYRNEMPILCETQPGELNKYVVIEKTPGYFRNVNVPPRVLSYNSKTKIILILRNPLTRLKSELTHCTVRKAYSSKKFKNCDQFRTSLASWRNESEYLSNKFVRNSLYYIDFRRWLNYFNLTSFHIVDAQEFVRRPWSELNKLETFLNVPNHIQEGMFYYNETKKFYCSIGNNGCLDKNKGRKHVWLGKIMEKKLGSFFQKWNNLLFTLIQKKFDW